MQRLGLDLKLFVTVLICGLPILAEQVPAGTEIPIRLKTRVSTAESKQGDAVEAAVISTVLAIPYGAAVRGTVEKVTSSEEPGKRATLLLRFTELKVRGALSAISALVVSVDNARESVNEQGEIEGILASETATGRMDSGLNKLGQRYPGLADLLSAAKSAVFQPPATDIDYPPGVELVLRLTAPVEVAGSPAMVPPLLPGPHSALEQLIKREPFQTMAQRPAKPSDVTNLLIAASELSLRRAFAEAGWSEAAALNAHAKFETARAVAEGRGYSEAPVSVLALDGKPPDLVFEKSTNTFAKRHHLRVWRRPGTFEGKPLWAIAATHDIGIDFSDVDGTFIHRIDPQIDRERDKVVSDLLFTGRVAGLGMQARSNVPHRGRNATGDSLETDSRIAVLLLR